MRIIYILFLLLFVTVGCDSLKQRNVAMYEKRMAAEEARKQPTEPTLKYKRVDDVSEESILDRDGLNDKEREVLNEIRDRERAKSQRRSKKVFGVFAPKRK
jgi:hypothetical protein